MSPATLTLARSGHPVSRRPVAQKRQIVQYPGRILRRYDGKTTTEVLDCHDELPGVLASSLAKRAPGYTSLGFPDPGNSPTSPARTWRP